LHIIFFVFDTVLLKYFQQIDGSELKPQLTQNYNLTLANRVFRTPQKRQKPWRILFFY